MLGNAIGWGSLHEKGSEWSWAKKADPCASMAIASSGSFLSPTMDVGLSLKCNSPSEAAVRWRRTKPAMWRATLLRETCQVKPLESTLAVLHLESIKQFHLVGIFFWPEKILFCFVSLQFNVISMFWDRLCTSDLCLVPRPAAVHTILAWIQSYKHFLQTIAF